MQRWHFDMNKTNMNRIQKNLLPQNSHNLTNNTKLIGKLTLRLKSNITYSKDTFPTFCIMSAQQTKLYSIILNR